MQNRNKIFIIAGAIALLIIIGLAIIPSRPTTPTEFSLKSIVLAKGATADKKPINQVEYFLESDESLYAIITYGYVPSGTDLEYQWYDLTSRELMKSEKKKIEQAASGNGVAFLTKKEGQWGRGQYEFRVMANGATVAKKEFAIKTPADVVAEQVGVSLQKVELSNKVTLSGQIVGKTMDTFSQDDKSVYASISYQELPEKTQMEARWKYLKNDYLIKSYKKTIKDGGTFAISIDTDTDSWIPIKKWPVGKYQLEIYFAGDLMKLVSFDVE